MIPFASQRGVGQDLATHLLNVHDNEELEFVGVRGAIARDLHGAFAEWEAQAHALTKCRNYLYSMSVNPDPNQDPLNRAQYMDYITRAEEKLGLSDQPRAVVFHRKHGREHCHVVWSRIDAEKGKAIHIAFDHQKLMMVTKEFAREHNLILPEGYEKKPQESRQLSLYEKVQQDETGITQAQRISDITSAWQGSDSVNAFLRALDDRGYILARGKRPYVVVDIYGHVNALSKLIDDRQVRTKHIREFLNKEITDGMLPTVEEAKEMAARQLKEFGDHQRAEDAYLRRKELERKQSRRRERLDGLKQSLEHRQRRERAVLSERHLAERRTIRQAYRAEIKRVRQERYQRRPRGLADFLGKVTGINVVRQKLHDHQDRKRRRQFAQVMQIKREAHRDEQVRLTQRHGLQTLDLDRQFRALAQVQARERKTMEIAIRKDGRIDRRAGKARVPEVYYEGPVPVVGGEHGTLEKSFDRALARLGPKTPEFDLKEEFGRAAGSEREQTERESEEGPSKESPGRTRLRRQRAPRRRGKSKDLDKER
ncbi:MAG: relaxase/mobilization nuclease domain-containing protein [Pseudomonadales bacterium]